MPVTRSRPTLSRLAVIDGLRGAAMSLVVLGHLWPGWVRPLPLSVIPLGAYIGLDLFFFVSGFGIFYLFARSTVDGGKEQSARDFSLRRVAKIFPSYYLCIAAVIALGWSNDEPGFAPMGAQVLTHVLFIHNLFPQTVSGIDGVMWSLAVECQFYLLFVFTRRLAVRRPVSYAATLVAIGLLYRSAVAIVFPRAYGYADAQLPAMLDIFGFGMACAYLYRRIDRTTPALARRRALWTGIAIAASLAIYADFYLNVAAVGARFPIVLEPIVRTLNGTLIFAFALASLFAVDGWKRAIGNRAFVFIAAISYNIYLYHQVIFLQCIRRFDPHAGHLGRAAIAVVAVACTVALATVLKRYYEQPIIDYLARFETGHSERVEASRIQASL
jgi:peptidoglycan/LPS O-acetylase OafA/YrhL